MPLGTKAGVGPGDTVLDGDPAPQGCTQVSNVKSQVFSGKSQVFQVKSQVLYVESQVKSQVSTHIKLFAMFRVFIHD